jgi:protein TonB
MRQPRANTSAGHLCIQLEGAHAADVPFLFDRAPKRLTLALGTSAVVDVVVAMLFVFASRYHPGPPVAAFASEELVKNIKNVVWFTDSRRAGGGGGGGNRMTEPPRRVELPGKDALTVPVAKPPAFSQQPVGNEPNPIAQLNIPAQTLAAAQDSFPGAIDGSLASTVSRGPGSGGGAGPGNGPGDGPGNGPGLGPGLDGGTGGDRYHPGSDVTTPVLLRQVKPSYTTDAMRAKVQGAVLLECLVRPDGSVGDVRVLRSLDSKFGLDEEAMKAAKQWRFRPGLRLGEPVPVLITIQLDFTLR